MLVHVFILVVSIVRMLCIILGVYIKSHTEGVRRNVCVGIWVWGAMVVC